MIRIFIRMLQIYLLYLDIICKFGSLQCLREKKACLPVGEVLP